MWFCITTLVPCQMHPNQRFICVIFFFKVGQHKLSDLHEVEHLWCKHLWWCYKGMSLSCLRLCEKLLWYSWHYPLCIFGGAFHLCSFAPNRSLVWKSGKMERQMKHIKSIYLYTRTHDSGHSPGTWVSFVKLRGNRFRHDFLTPYKLPFCCHASECIKWDLIFPDTHF